MPTYDLVLRDGTLVDPAQGISALRDVAFLRRIDGWRKIAAVLRQRARVAA